MIRISDALKEIIQSCDFLQFGIAHRLLNLSKVTTYIKPLVEARTKKEVTDAALLMNLSRLQRDYSKIMPQICDFKLDNINMFSNLATITFDKTPNKSKKANKYYQYVKGKDGYINITESSTEITIIVDEKYLEDIKKYLKNDPKYLNKDVVGISVSFTDDYYQQPGIIYILFQQLTLQGINVIELSSTFTELILYIEQKDIKVAFDSLLNRFFDNS